MNKNNENWEAASSMFLTYMQGRNVSGNVTQDTLDNLSERFSHVERDDRAEVYMKFTALLDGAGVQYDTRSFAY